MRHIFSMMAAMAVTLGPAMAEEPFRLHAALDLSEKWEISGKARIRYETLQGQFRANRADSDQLIAMRTAVHARYDAGAITFGAELQDSRTYLADAGTPLSSSIANPLDFIQAYVEFDQLPGLIGGAASSTLRIGRQTVSIGSKRQIERQDFANVTKSYTGAHYTAKNDRGDELHAIYVVPTARFPNSRPDLDDNVLSGDEEQWERRIWGVHYRRAEILPQVPGLAGEVFVYGLDEQDTEDFATPDRSHVAPGFRLHRKPKTAQWDIDLEGALRRGTRYATSAATDETSLDVEASMLFAALGYSFDTSWRPRFALEYYYASGDDDPNDDVYGQHERLFGSRRGDLNNTSIYGPFTPANISAPGFRVEVKPSARWDGRLYYHAAHLASDTDSWVVARRRDETGQSGDFIGHALDGRARYWVVPDSLRMEVGASGLLYGEFAENVPNPPEGDGSLYGFAQMTLSF